MTIAIMERIDNIDRRHCHSYQLFCLKIKERKKEHKRKHTHNFYRKWKEKNE